MNFRADLEQIIKEQFDSNDICYEANMDVDHLAARYLEIQNRWIVLSPRNVVFSLEGLNPPAVLIDSLREDRCLSRDLCRMGFVIVETITRRPVIVSIEG